MVVDPASLAASLLIPASLLFPADDLPLAQSILEKVEAALGEPAAREKATVIIMKGGMEIPGMGRVEHEQVFSGTDRVKFTSTFPEMGSQTQGATPEFAWSTDPASGITIKEGKERLGVARGYAIERRAPWNSLYDSARTLGRVDLGGKPHYELEMTPKEGGEPDRWFVDVATHLPTAFGTTLPDPQGGALAVRFVFDDWQDIGGALLPYKKTLEISGISLTFVFDSIVRTIFVDEEKLAPPPEVIEAFKDPSKRATQAGAHGVCSITEIPEESVVSIRVTIGEAEVSQQLAILYTEIMRYVTKAKLTIAAPPFARMHSIVDGKIDMEAGMAVRGNAPGEGRVVMSKLPGGRVATTWHVGPYHDLKKTCGQLEAWIKEQKLSPAGGLWEVFWTDPGIEPDATKWRTQILWPVK